MVPARQDGGARRQVLHRLQPRHRQHAGESVGTCVQLNSDSDGLDPAHGLVALTAARVMHRSRFVVIKKSRLTAAAATGCAAHAGKAQMHSTR